MEVKTDYLLHVLLLTSYCMCSRGTSSQKLLSDVMTCLVYSAFPLANSNRRVKCGNSISVATYCVIILHASAHCLMHHIS